MQHVRRQIVLAVVAQLQRGVAGVTSVQDGRAAPLPVGKTPYLLVYARTEEVRAIAGRSLDDDDRLRRLLGLVVEIVVADDATDSDARLDGFCLAVEKAMAADRRLGGIVEDLLLARSELAARFETESRIARARMEFSVEYHTTAARPEIHLE